MSWRAGVSCIADPGTLLLVRFRVSNVVGLGGFATGTGQRCC
jgi:hypothetical protein